MPVMVSVICTAYNHEKYIGQALQSFVNQQTDFDFEVLVSDDASTDNTAAIIEAYARSYPDIVRFFPYEVNQYSQGISIAEEVLLPNARGKYIAVCEGDDYWCDDRKLSKQYDCLERHPGAVMCVHPSWKHYIETDSKVPFSDFHLSEVSEDSLLRPETILNDLLIFHTSSMFIKNSFFCRNKDFIKEIRLDDYALKTMLALEGDVWYLPDYMSVYRKGVDGSWSKRMSENEYYIAYLKESVDVLRKIDDYYGQRQHDLLTREISRRVNAIDMCKSNNNKIMAGVLD